MNQNVTHRYDRRIVIALVFVLALPAFTSATARADTATPRPDCSRTPSGLLLAGTGFADGQPEPGLNVIEPATGKTLRTVDIPAAVFGLPASLPNHALVQTLDGNIYIIDAKTGGAIKIEPPAKSTGQLSLSSFQIADSAGTRWTLISDGSDSSALLVDLQTGKAIDLKAFLDGKLSTPIIASAAVSSDDAHALVWDGIKLFIVPIADPNHLRQLGGDTSFAGSFSPNGNRVVYTTQSTAAAPNATPFAQKAQTQLIVENADGGDQRVVATSPYTIQARWIDNDRLAIDRIVDAGSEKVSRFSVLDVQTGSTLPILTYSVNAASVDVREGRWLLHEHQDGDNRLYTWIDLKTGTLISEPDLTNLFPVRTRGARWTTFFDPTIVVGREDAPYVGFDMETGKTVRGFTQHTGNSYLPVARTSPDGQISALTVYRGDETQLWLLNNATGGSRQVAIPGTTGVAFSPDGCWLATAAMTGSGTRRTSMLSIVPVDGGDPIGLGPGQAPIWLPNP